MKIKISSIVWDKDEDDDTELPAEVEADISEIVPNIEEMISDWLSDKFGYCHCGFHYDYSNAKNRK